MNVNTQNQKAIIFYAKAGGGHESAARSIQQSLLKKNFSEVVVVDIFSTSSTLTQYTFNEAYILAISKFPWIWRIMCYLWSVKAFFIVNFWFAKVTSNARSLIKQEVEKLNPDVVITTYFSLDVWISEVLQQMGKNTPILSVVVDIFSPHNSWFLKSDTNFCVFSQEAAQVASTSGVLPSHIHTFDGFFDERFLQLASENDQQKICTENNLNRNLFTVMLSGGGPGIPATIPIIKEILALSVPLNLIVICGRNEGLKKQVQQLLSSTPSTVTSIVTGFTNQMHELTSISDIIIAKAGPATVFEVLAIKKPTILAHYIWPQEKGNVDFFLKNNYGLYETNPVKIARKILFYQKNPDQLSHWNKNLESVKVTSGINNLVHFIQQKVEQSKR